MQEPKRFPPRFKILAAAITILIINAALVLIFGNRRWEGLETLITAADLTPLSGLFWPVVEVLAGAIFFGVSYLSKKLWLWLTGLWGKWWKRRLEKEYRRGYNAGMMEEPTSRRSDDFAGGGE